MACSESCAKADEASVVSPTTRASTTPPLLAALPAIGCSLALRRARERAVDHFDRVIQAIDRDEGAETRALLLSQQHLIEHVEPVEGDAGPAVLGELLVIEERLAPADLVDHLLDFLRRGVGGKLRQRIAQGRQSRALGVARLSEFFCRQ